MASTTMESAEPAIRPLSMRSFRRDLDKFEKYIARITMQDSDASVDEKRQKINENLRYEPFCERIRKYFGPDIKTEDVKAIFRKISTNPDVKIDWSEVFGYFQAETEDGDGEEKSVFAVSKRKKIGEAAGDKKRRDIIQCITYSPEYDLYVTASQKGAISIYNGKSIDHLVSTNFKRTTALSSMADALHFLQTSNSRRTYPLSNLMTKYKQILLLNKYYPALVITGP